MPTMSQREVTLSCDGRPYRASIRCQTKQDTRVLVEIWAPALDRGPSNWLDREWTWHNLVGESAFPTGCESLVIADDVENECRGDILGILVTTGPHEPATVGLPASGSDSSLLWVEYIAIAPSLRDDCPSTDARQPRLTLIGPQLMLSAIQRSSELGCTSRLGLHAEGEKAQKAYLKWGMKQFPAGAHPCGGSYPVFYGDSAWAESFQNRLEAKLRSSGTKEVAK